MAIESLQFDGEMDTYLDYGMLPVKKLVFESPSTKTNFVDITGTDDSLDLTEVLTGFPTFFERQSSFSFRFIDNGVPARSRLTQLLNYLHGKRKTAIISDEPEFYYDARWEVVDPKYKKVGEFADVEIKYVCKAHKMDITSALEDWLWDPFNFETGVIREYGNIALSYNTAKTIVVVGSSKPTPLKVILSINAAYASQADNVRCKMEYGGVEYDLSLGANIFPNIILLNSEYELIFTLTAGVTEAKIQIDYRGGWL